MYLERIEMTGFKSFADKTVIEFDQGMTAVVGPNGSGKSNLSEAIRWVLGEQSAKSLRGHRMEDVIFNGSQARKPVNLAKVTLVLNNEDHYLDHPRDRVAITRQLNRQGESAYFINQEAVRLKDITDLLLDTGLGKNSFAMISQGKVESIFLSKPEERRGIFEEAAGVQKFQVRKLEAQRKMDRSQGHLNRVKDILHELADQIDPLKDQHDKALIYQEKAELLSQHELAWYTQQIKTNQVRYQQAQVEGQAVRQELDQVQSQQAHYQETLQASQEQVDHLNDQIDQEAENLQIQTQQVEQQKGQESILRQRLDYAHQSEEDRHHQAISRQEERDQLEGRLAKLDQEIQALQAADQQDQLELEEVEEQLATLLDQDPARLGHLQEELIEAYRRETTIKNQAQQVQQVLETYQARKGSHDQQVQGLQEELNHLNQDLSDAKQEVQSLQRDLSQAQDQIKRQQGQQVQLEADYQARAQEAYQVDHDRQVLQAKLNSLQQMQADYTGYYQGVRAVMNQRDHLPGIEGTVADLIQVSDEYQEAIELALGAALQQIVVRDDQAAKAAIDYLRQTRSGRATFLPRPNIKGRSLASHLLAKAQGQAGLIGVASDLVQAATENQAIVQQLLGTTLVMTDLPAAQALSKRLNQQVKLVTLTGDVILPGGSVTGGRDHKARQTMLARQTQVKSVEADYQEKQAIHQDLQTRLQKDQVALRAMAQDLVNQRQAYQALSEQFEAANHHYQGLDRQVQQKERQLMVLEDEWTSLHSTYQESQQEEGQIQSDLDQIQAQIDHLKSSMEALQLDQSDRQTRSQELQAELNRVGTHRQVLQVEIKQKLRDQKTFRDQLEALDQLMADHANQVRLNQETVQSLESDLASVLDQIEGLTQANQASQDRLKEAKAQRQAINQSLREVQAQALDLDKHLQGLYQKEAKAQALIEKYDRLLDQDLAYLSETHSLSYEAAVVKVQEFGGLETSLDQVKKLKKAIDQLGPINLAAIEDYQALKDRYDRLTNQEEDLVQAMNQLQATIEEMDQEVASRFKATFDQINQQFQKTFVQLFGGGRARLELIDPDQLLETGVDIIAQPPGKRQQHLALLSGGERALTAISLLFAILETKAVPFVVLDEVEAALDDANVYRYGRYIQAFTQATQFIVITHRKGTMEYADVLYGVTMEQTGISKLASVQLNEASAMAQGDG